MPLFSDPTRKSFNEPVTVAVDDAWPEKHLLPRDEIGARIIAYRDANEGRPDFPPSPWDDRTGTILLPNLDEPRAATDEMPRYRVKELAAFIGPNLYQRGQEVSYPSWPDHPHQIEAVNESGRLVLSYMNRFAAGQKLSGLVHRDGQLFFPNPALRGSPISPTLRWAGAGVGR